MHASHNEGMIPRSWNDFRAGPLASIPASLVDPIAGTGPEDGRGDCSFAESGAVGSGCVGVVCFTLFDGIASSLSEVPSTFLFLIGDMVNLSERTSQQLGLFTRLSILP